MAAEEHAGTRGPVAGPHELARLAAERQRAALAIVDRARLQRVQALALRGWARSLRRRDRRARFEAAMLREEAQSLHGVQEAAQAGSADRTAAGSSAEPAP